MAFAQKDAQTHSPAISGFLGLNTVPNARMDKTGTIRAGISTLDPFVHGFIGVQLAKPLYLQLRQTSQTSGIFHDTDKLLPGADFKLRLTQENAHRPAIVLGVQSAIGHKRMAGEYLALSKRYKNADFTAGLGWGRYGTAAHIENPLGLLHSHFKKRRDIINEDPNTPADWFTGESVGFFGGIEYFLPVRGLSLKLDYGADRYTAQSALLNYDRPSPWGAGLSYSYNDWAQASVGIQGTDRVMGRISIKSSPAKWPFTYNDNALSPQISGIDTSTDQYRANIHLPKHAASPHHIGIAAANAITTDHPTFKEISLTLKSENLTGPTINLLKTDIENAAYNNNRSPNEIWQNTSITSESTLKQRMPRKAAPDINVTLGIENQLSLSEEDSGILYRSSALIGAKTATSLGFMGVARLRVNLSDNLEKLHDLRPKALLPVRSDIDAFADNTVNADRMFGSYTQTIIPNVHAALSAGYLEEFYAGFGGEILYRPIQSRFALGLEAWQAFRRDPNTSLAIGLNGQQVTTGHANIWYDLPYHNVTAKLSAGRFLAGDTGISFGLEKQFLNGARLQGQISVSNASDPDIYGETTHAYHSLTLTLPIGSIPYMPNQSNITTTFAPLGRDIAQKLNAPIDLFSLTTPFTRDHITTHWQKVTKK